MSEKAVFWLGGKPGKPAAMPKPEDAEQVISLIARNCETNGYRVGDHVAAHGAFGSWLLNLEKEQHQHRLVWNGKDKRLVFERAVNNGWEELDACSPTSPEAADIAEGVDSLLGGSAEREA